MKNLVIIIVVLAFAVSCPASEQEKKYIPHFFGWIGLEPRVATPPVKSISNVPDYIRNIPVHPDDWGWEGMILADSARAPWPVDVTLLKTGLEWDLKDDVKWQVFGNLSWNIGHWMCLGGEVKEKNYKDPYGGDDRGYGTALTFWAPSYSRWIPGLATELHFPRKHATTTDLSHWLIGAEVRKYDLQIMTGYDRYDRLKHEHHYNIGDITEESIYIGVVERNASNFVALKTGLKFHQYESGKKYKDVDVRVNDIGWFIMLSMGWAF